MISETRKKLVIMGLPGAYLIFRALPNIAFHPSPKRKAVGSVSPAGSVGAPASQGVPPAHRTPPGTLFSGVGTVFYGSHFFVFRAGFFNDSYYRQYRYFCL